MKHFFTGLLLALLLGLAARKAHAQTKLVLPQVSPAVTIRQAFSTSFVELRYCRPSLKGRQAFGGLVPYGQVWRTGANTATKIRLGEAMQVGGQAVPAGTYSLFTIPGKTDWTIILNRDTAQWGAYEYNQQLDVVRIIAHATMLAVPHESLTLTLENVRPTAADLTLSWEHTQVSISLLAHPDALILNQIQEAMQGEKKPYFTAALYYYHSNQPNLTPAVGWLDAFLKAHLDSASDQYEGYYWKAKLLQKQGKKQEAVAAARQSLQWIKADKNEVAKAEYTLLNQQLLSEVGAKL
ncbi:DUF2911 domain-containing protein [Hymenobacter volaticus]|uniref:DUF2911 domain-containing protein n=1 Tax=Hymenobacter volaticus TaxID=2932254 RepID=A0ABY4GE51_9BACT|nr:DUF2911 domain-containing protein [Hymenobacter volaticus]UOQ69180.1 DUF2911 domain-containing protein [Hymenobacter volaticus]